MDEEEKRLLEAYGRLSRYAQHVALAQIIFAAEAENNARKIAGAKVKKASRRTAKGPMVRDQSDTPLFNGTGVLQSPSYALPRPGPVMEAAV